MAFLQLTMTAKCLCAMGVKPSDIAVIPTPSRVSVCGKPAINMMDQKTMVNIPPFGMCNSPTNPAVIAATSAALGVFTPAPCTPLVAGPISNTNPTVLIDGMAAAHITSMMTCGFSGGAPINPIAPSQTTVFV